MPSPSSSEHYYPAENPHGVKPWLRTRLPDACSGSDSNFVIFPSWGFCISSPQMLWCWTRHEAHAAFSHWERYLVSSLIAGCLCLWSFKELNILWLLWLCQIRVKSANRFICHGQGLRHTGTAENPSKTAPTDIPSFYMDVRPVVAKQLIEWNAAPGKIPCEFSRARISPNN